MTSLQRNPALDVLVFLFPLAVYLVTCAPGIGFGDTAIIIDNIYNLRLNSQVNTHPLSVLVGQLFLALPFDSIAYKANLMSVFAGSVSVFLLYKALCYALDQRLVPALAAGLFTFSKSMWWHSTVVENYAVSSVVTGFALIAFVRLWRSGNGNWLKLLFFLVGLGFYNHVQFGFMGMGVGVAFLLHLRRERAPLRLFLHCGIALLVGLAPWIATVLHDYSQSGDLALTLKMATVGVFGGTMFSVSFLQGLQDTAFVYFLEYPHLFLPVPFIGIYFAGRRMGWASPAFWGVFTYVFGNSAFFAYYSTWDRFAFLLQSFMLLTFFGAFALASLFEYLDGRRQVIARHVVTALLVGCMA
ncbi:MAG: DUF2723 domain-containing protein, partial [Halioglobus sp.]|nr:DUF2723 domain-containing protein [Halioglobus sp.]